jgi:hypothetical protein
MNPEIPTNVIPPGAVFPNEDFDDKLQDSPHAL